MSLTTIPFLASFLGLGMGVAAQAPSADSSNAFVGLWEARLRFGPDVRGSLSIVRDGGEWRAEIAGRSTAARVTADTLTFAYPDGSWFRGRMRAGGATIVGHWVQPRTVANGTPYASPIVLDRQSAGRRWVGVIDPLEDEFTMQLMVEPRPDGTLHAFLRNPERNIGRFTRINSMERDGETVRLRAAGANGRRGRVLATGVLRGRTMSIPLRGGTYDFRRVGPDEPSDFYPRGRPGVGAEYVYRAPPALDDGWSVGIPEDVGMSRDALESFVRMIIDTPIDGVSAPAIHGVLVARRGTLVLEEYFHGEHRDKPHDTRSAAKSLAATLVGAAVHAGIPIAPSTPVYGTMNASDRGDPRKRALTVEHLLTMSSGLDCDDRDPNSPGNEDAVAEQDDEPDWWKLTLGLDMIRDPGERSVYCSINPHLAGGVLQTAAGRPLPELFHDLIAEPLGIRRYWLNLAPTGVAYMGGGARFLLRDFMKLGQLMVNGGTWNGRRVVSEEWAERSTSPLVPLRRLGYGYLWWVVEYPSHDDTVQAFFAAGNGGQLVMGVPALDLVIGFYAGNYSDPVLYRTQRELVPEFVLPAVTSR